MKSKKCVSCESMHRDIYPLCRKCMEKEGGQYTASNFNLSGLSVTERQLVFLWACGKDISGYFDKTPVEAYAPDNEDLSELLSFLNTAPHFANQFLKVRKV